MTTWTGSVLIGPNSDSAVIAEPVTIGDMPDGMVGADLDVPVTIVGAPAS